MTAHEPTVVVARAAGGVHTVRRVITYLLLFIMVIIAAIGVSGLLERLLKVNEIVLQPDTYGLAQSLAFALIAGPLAALLWWLTWRDSARVRDRASVAWPVYLVITSTVTLLTFTIALFTWAADAVTGTAQLSGLAVPIVWGLVWLWHYWMWRHPRKGPTRLLGVAPAIGSLIGLTYGVGGLVFALAALIDSSLDTFGTIVVMGVPLWQTVLQSLVWAVGGGLLWWWHWFRAGVRTQTTGFSTVLLVYVAGFASFALFAFGVTFTLAVILELVTGSPDPIAVTLDPLGVSISAALFGALVLVYHARVVAQHAPVIGAATRLVSAGVSLAVAATGVGVTVNALLATLATPIIDYTTRNLLLAGVSALVVGGALWWATWRPAIASATERVATPGRRAYLVVIFGLSALVALITLLVIGFQLFLFVLDGGSGASFIERSRQALGLLAATVLVAVYHFSIWKKDRASGVVFEQTRRIDRITLVVSTDATELAAAIHASTGARVTVLRRAVTAEVTPDAAVVPVTVVPDAVVLSALDEALAAFSSNAEVAHLLLIVGQDSRVEAILLAN